MLYGKLAACRTYKRAALKTMKSFYLPILMTIFGGVLYHVGQKLFRQQFILSPPSSSRIRSA